jgi:chlorobactene glucosyltransferase
MNISQVDIVSLVTVETAIVTIVAFMLFVFYYFLRPLKTRRIEDQNLPFVSVIVPARNEELKVERCLRSLANQDYPNFEIIVVDDLSTDRTGEIIRNLSTEFPVIKAVSGTVNPDGWIGKCNAIVQAGGHASGQWLIFTDADTCHDNQSVRKAVSFAIENQVDLISFMPLQELGSFWEKTIMPPLLSSFLLGDCLHMVNWPDASRAYAYGQYILARASSYHAVGGHQSVRDEIVEDFALARAFKTSGRRIMVVDGRSLYKVRMYLGLETLWHGWVKNLYSFAECNPLFLTALLVAMNCVLVAPFIEFGTALAYTSQYTSQLSNFSLILLSLATVQLGELFIAGRLTAKHIEGTRWYHFFLFPLSGVMISALYMTSAFKVMSGSKINWKGRSYRVTSARTIDRSSSQAPNEEAARRRIPT